MVQMLSRARDAELDTLRNRHIGFVFQFHHLLPDQDAVHNVMIPHSSAVCASQRLEIERLRCWSGVWPSGWITVRASCRVVSSSALLAALVQGPKLLLADEPTGNLDPDTAAEMLDLMLSLNEEQETTLLVVTHSLALADRFPRQLALENGQFVERPCA